MIELSIKVKDENMTLVEKEVIYEAVLLTRENPYLNAKIKAVLDKFKAEEGAEKPDITLKIKMIW